MKLAVLASGGGTNLQAILDASGRGELPQVVRVLSDVAAAPALERARAAGVPALAVDPKAFPSRLAFDEAVAAELRRAGAELVCLAGYLRIVGKPLLDAFPGRILNIHPALLPAFPGLKAQAQALAAGVRLSGCTVHFVDAGTDTGPIIGQVAVPVLPSDTIETLSARILAQEHRLYPKAIGWVASGQVREEGGRALWRPDVHAEGALASPAL